MPELQTTDDGSHTLYLPDIDEHYHSTYGAKSESKHVYIEAGFKHCHQPEIAVLELGFGTGLNALLTFIEAEAKGISVDYTALELYPLSETIYNKLNYDRNIQLFHRCPWEEPIALSPFFTLTKVQTDFNQYIFPTTYDVVYYDAFAPDKQPEAWNQPLFDRLYAAMNASGVLTTYCSKGNIRRMMQQAGFVVERLPGPPGKREILRARK